MWWTAFDSIFFFCKCSNNAYEKYSWKQFNLFFLKNVKKIISIRIRLIFKLEFDIEWKILIVTRFREMNHTFTSVECIDVLDLIVAQFEIKNIDIFFNSLWCYRFWDGYRADIKLKIEITSSWKIIFFVFFYENKFVFFFYSQWINTYQIAKNNLRYSFVVFLSDCSQFVIVQKWWLLFSWNRSSQWTKCSHNNVTFFTEVNQFLLIDLWRCLDLC